MKKVYAITYYTGDGEETIMMFANKTWAEEYVKKRNMVEPETKHSGGPYYRVVEWEVQ